MIYFFIFIYPVCILFSQSSFILFVMLRHPINDCPSTYTGFNETGPQLAFILAVELLLDELLELVLFFNLFENIHNSLIKPIFVTLLFLCKQKQHDLIFKLFCRFMQNSLRTNSQSLCFNAVLILILLKYENFKDLYRL